MTRRQESIRFALYLLYFDAIHLFVGRLQALSYASPLNVSGFDRVRMLQPKQHRSRSIKELEGRFVDNADRYCSGGACVPYTFHEVADFAFLEVSVQSKRSVALVAQLRRGFGMIFARKQPSIRRLDFQAPNLRTTTARSKVSLASSHFSVFTTT
jgi:hypothetical protein